MSTVDPNKTGGFPISWLAGGSILLSGIGIWYLNASCHIQFEKTGLDFVAYLVPFGIVAMLIERFVNVFLLKQENQTLKTEIRTKGLSETVSENDNTDTAPEERHSRKFVHRSFLIGLIIAAFGFRFFADITNEVDCSNVADYGYIFNAVDVFLTGILLSGGSQFVNRIGQYLADILKT